MFVAGPRCCLGDGQRVARGTISLEAASGHVGASELVALGGSGGGVSAEEYAEAYEGGALADQGLDDGEICDDDGDKGFATGPGTS